MKILVTGSKGFVGKNLCERLRMIRDKKDPRYPALYIEDVMEVDKNTPVHTLIQYCSKANFIFHLAGVNRPQNTEEYMKGNLEFTKTLTEIKKSAGNNCPIMFASSIQAAMTGRYGTSDYGKSKSAAEKVLLNYEQETGAKVLIYRFPNLFGKWCRPNYNSVTATFCYNVARGLPLQIHEPDRRLEFLYIDDLTEGMVQVLSGKEQRCRYENQTVVPDSRGPFCYVTPTYKITLQEMANMLKEFHARAETQLVPEQPDSSFRKKLYSTYISYLPKEAMIFPLKMNTDERGSFTELFKSLKCGQVSVNISKPGITKGQHWHNSKWEIFIVVSGHGMIQERKIGTDEILEFEVSGERIEAVHMLPGYTHNIINLSDTEDLITIMWANELFHPQNPDTYYEEV